MCHLTWLMIHTNTPHHMFIKPFNSMECKSFHRLFENHSMRRSRSVLRFGAESKWRFCSLHVLLLPYLLLPIRLLHGVSTRGMPRSMHVDHWRKQQSLHVWLQPPSRIHTTKVAIKVERHICIDDASASRMQANEVRASFFYDLQLGLRGFDRARFCWP